MASGSGGFSICCGDGYGEDGAVRVWNMADGSLKTILNGYGAAINVLRLSADGNMLFSSTDYGGLNMEGKPYLWDLASHTRTVLDTSIKYVSFGPREPIAALIDYDYSDFSGSLYLLDTQLGLQTPLFKNREGYLGDAIFSPDGTLLVAGSNIWNVQTGKAIELDQVGVRAAFSQDGSLLAYFDDDGVVIWDVKTQTEHLRIDADNNYFDPIFFSSDGTLIFADNKLWDVQTGLLAADLTPPRFTGDFYPMAYISADSKIIAIADGFGIRLWGVPQS